MISELIPPEYLVLLAGAAFTLGYLIIHQAFLRCMMLIGTFFYIWYYAVVADVPLWTAIYTSCIMGVANLIGLASLFARQSRWAIPPAHRDIVHLFPGLPPGDFRSLMKLATRETLDQGLQATREGASLERLYYVISGGMRVEKQGERFRMPAGVFVGEVAYLTHQNSAATSQIDEGSEVLSWQVDQLRRKAKRSSRFKLALEATISRDLATKVSFAVAPKARQYADQAN